MERYFWAWKKLKRREEKIEAPHELTDQAFLSALLDAIIAKDLPEGDGKFARIYNYVRGVRTEVEWARTNWVGSDEVFTAFFLGIEAMITELERVTEKVKKGR